MVTQLQPDVRAYLHGGEVIKRYIRAKEGSNIKGFATVVFGDSFKITGAAKAAPLIEWRKQNGYGSRKNTYQ